IAGDLAQELLGVVEELARGRLLQDRGEATLELPGVEEELPVDVRNELLERWLDHSRFGELGNRKLVEVDPLAVRAGLLDRQERLSLLLGMLCPEPLLELRVFLLQRGSARCTETGGEEPHAR